MNERLQVYESILNCRAEFCSASGDGRGGRWVTAEGEAAFGQELGGEYRGKSRCDEDAMEADRLGFIPRACMVPTTRVRWSS